MVVRWELQAHKQLKGIFYFLKENASLKIAQRIRANIKSTADRLGRFPFLGQIEASLVGRAYNYRSLVTEKHYKIIYYIEKETVYIFAIWDVRQDPQKLITT